MKGSGGGSNEITGAWYITDVPLCVLLGSVVGALMSFSTAAATAIARVKRSAMAGREVTTTTSGASWKNANSFGAPKKRKKRSSSKVSEIVAAVFPVVLVSVLAFVLPLLFECRVRQDHVKGKPGASHLLGGQHQVDHRMFVRFTCQQGEYNDLASLLLPSLSGSFHSTMSHLYSRDSGTYCISQIQRLFSNTRLTLYFYLLQTKRRTATLRS